MKKSLISSIILFIWLIFGSGCNSAIYEIVEVEEPVEIKEEPKLPVADIKDDMTTKEDMSTKEEEKLPETKYTTDQVVSQTYIVQIGAFLSERSAEKLTRSASKIIKEQPVYYKNVDGLYKVRIGNFEKKEDALDFLYKVRALNYTDSFVFQITNVIVK